MFERNTYVHGHGWFGPSYPGAEVTPEVEAAVRKARGETTPDADEGQSAPDGGGGSADSGPPPKAGPGATKAAWVEYGRAHGVDVDAGAPRDDIIAVVERVLATTG